MYDIVPWFGEVIAVVLAILVFVFVSLLCITGRGRVYPNRSLEDGDSVLNYRDLCAELKTVIKWYRLGTHLGVPTDELSKIERDYQGDQDRQMLAMLDLWLRRTPNATWNVVVSALEEMEEIRVADIIRQKHIRGKSKASYIINNKITSFLPRPSHRHQFLIAYSTGPSKAWHLGWP